MKRRLLLQARAISLTAVTLAIGLGASPPVHAQDDWGPYTEFIMLSGTLETQDWQSAQKVLHVRKGTFVWDVILGPEDVTDTAGVTADSLLLSSEVKVYGYREPGPGHWNIRAVRIESGPDNFILYPGRQ